MECLICNNAISMLSSTKINNSKICKTCALKLPSLFVENSFCESVETLKHAMRITNENYDKFSVTASYGNLHIDALNGLFAIAKSLDKNGKPKEGMNIFSIFDLSQVGLYCTNPRKDHQSVLVDVEFSCQLENLHLSFKHNIKKGIACQTRRVDAEHIRWEEPSDLEMFRTLFNQMLSRMHDQINSFLYGKTIHEFDVEKARALFMLYENYNLDELNMNFQRMMKVWQPENYEETKEAKILKENYNLLVAELEYNEKKEKFGF